MKNIEFVYMVSLSNTYILLHDVKKMETKREYKKKQNSNKIDCTLLVISNISVRYVSTYTYDMFNDLKRRLLVNCVV